MSQFLCSSGSDKKMAESKGSLLAKSVSKHAGRAKEKVNISRFTSRRIINQILVRKLYQYLFNMVVRTSDVMCLPLSLAWTFSFVFVKSICKYCTEAEIYNYFCIKNPRERNMLILRILLEPSNPNWRYSSVFLIELDVPIFLDYIFDFISPPEGFRFITSLPRACLLHVALVILDVIFRNNSPSSPDYQNVWFSVSNSSQLIKFWHSFSMCFDTLR